MEKSDFYLDENRNLTVKESYRLDESDFLCLNDNVEFLKEEIEKIIFLLIFRTTLMCGEIEKCQDEFWDKVNKTQELSRSDVEKYAMLREKLTEALRFNDKIEDVYSDCIRLLGEVQDLLKELL